MVLPKTWYEYFPSRSSERVKSYEDLLRYFPTVAEQVYGAAAAVDSCLGA